MFGPFDLVISCSIENKCHTNAQCVYNERIDRHVCLCRTGYKGDGITCRHERKFFFSLQSSKI